jgi:hypothetical protein
MEGGISADRLTRPMKSRLYSQRFIRAISCGEAVEVIAGRNARLVREEYMCVTWRCQR